MTGRKNDPFLLYQLAGGSWLYLPTQQRNCYWKLKTRIFQQRRVNLGLILSKLVLSSVPFQIGQFIYFSGITNCDFDRKIEINEKKSILLSAIYWEFYFPFWHFVVLGFFPKWELADNQAFSNLRNSFKSKPDDRAFSMSSFTTLHPIAKLSFLQV